MKTIIESCDLCKKETEIKEENIQVIFITEQTEGRSITPYLSLEKFDICENCMDKILRGNYVFGYGAQGHNSYYFEE